MKTDELDYYLPSELIAQQPCEVRSESKLLVLNRSSGEVIDGHLRLKAARHLELPEVPVIIADDLTDAQIKAFRISVNRMAELAEWDMDLLSLELKDLGNLEFDIELTGFTEDFINNFFNTEGESLTDEITEPKVKLSDRFMLPPFSVLNAREGWWQARKKAWIALGIKSELGRGGG